MLKKFFILILSIFFLFSCGKKNKEEIGSEPNNQEIGKNLYAEGVEALNEGDAFYAAKKFREAEVLLQKYSWASKASLMASYADYTRNSYSNAIFSLEKHISSYPADDNIEYVHYVLPSISSPQRDVLPLII